jgi:histidine ammonia-lyase
LFARLAGIARGASGLSPALAETICGMLNSGVHPRAKHIGAFREGDLAVTAELFLFIGAGEAELDGPILGGSEALHRCGFELWQFGLKDTVALISANSCFVGNAALASRATEHALEVATAAGALSLEAYRANHSPIDLRVSALGPAPGQTDAILRLFALL